jgi:hypothetical protein
MLGSLETRTGSGIMVRRSCCDIDQYGSGFKIKVVVPLWWTTLSSIAYRIPATKFSVRWRVAIICARAVLLAITRTAAS